MVRLVVSCAYHHFGRLQSVVGVVLFLILVVGQSRSVIWASGVDGLMVHLHVVPFRCTTIDGHQWKEYPPKGISPPALQRGASRSSRTAVVSFL